MISYSAATAAIGINLATGVHTGFAAGDVFTNVPRYGIFFWVEEEVASNLRVKVIGNGCIA